MNEDLPIGAHLVTPRRGYLHHGIYAGQGRVIHYAGFHHFLRSGPVEEVTIQQFAKARSYEIKSHATPSFSGDMAVSRARSRLGENRYSLLTNNCEHFLEWCITGEHRSAQAEAVWAKLQNVRAAFHNLFSGDWIRRTPVSSTI